MYCGGQGEAVNDRLVFEAQILAFHPAEEIPSTLATPNPPQNSYMSASRSPFVLV